MNTILITGANRGLGLELSCQYYQAGWHVIACVRNPARIEKLEQLKTSSKQGQLSIYTLDVTYPEQIQTLAEKLENQPIDILLNNAGIWGSTHQTFENLDTADWLNTLYTNTCAPLLMARAFIQHIATSELKIIANMSSIMGSISLNTTGGDYIYRTSKAALNAVTKNLAIDLKDKKIIVAALHPGWVKTDMGGSAAAITPQESCEGIVKVLNSLTLEKSGIFIDYQGTIITY